MMVKLVELLPRQEELSTSGNPIAALVLAHFKTQETHGDPESRREWKLRLVRGLYERGWSEDRVRRMFRVIDRMMQLPEGLELAFRSQMLDWEKEMQMPYVSSIERLAMKEGEERGEQRGEQRGELKSKIEDLLEVLEIRFHGQPPADLVERVRATTDVARLKAWFSAAVLATSPEPIAEQIRRDAGHV